MEPVVAALAFLLALVFLVACTAFVRERRHVLRLQKLLAGEKALVDRTSKLLVEKNLELFDQNMRLERSLEAKTDFVAVASHQLRTPVTEIKWRVESFLDGSYGTLSPGQKEQTNNLLVSAEKMIRLIDELLRFVDAEAGYKEHAVTQTNLDALALSVLDQAMARFADKKITVERDFMFGDTPLSVDANMIEVAMANLIDNAFYYTPPGGTIRVATRKDGDYFRFFVSDSGIGIPADKRDTIFKKFHRSREALSMHSGGVGLGLYISKNIIEQHHGTIGFESETGKGATFHFTVPINHDTVAPRLSSPGKSGPA